MIDKTTPLTPSLKRLLIEFSSKTTIDRAAAKKPIGPFGLAAEVAAEMIEDPGSLQRDLKRALDDMNIAILAVRRAPDPNPYKDSTDEEIATAILDRLKEKRAAQ